MDEKEIIYGLRTSERTTIKLEVQQNGRVMVYAPIDCKLDCIDAFVEKHRTWIEKKKLEVNEAASYFDAHVTSELINALNKDSYAAFIMLVRKIAEETGICYRSITIKSQKSRWGSCNNHGDLYFNWKCELLPDFVKKYLVVHELCHIKEFNHSKAFYKEVEKYMPNYKDAMMWLKKYGNYYLYRLDKSVG